MHVRCPQSTFIGKSTDFLSKLRQRLGLASLVEGAVEALGNSTKSNCNKGDFSQW